LQQCAEDESPEDRLRAHEENFEKTTWEVRRNLGQNPERGGFRFPFSIYHGKHFIPFKIKTVRPIGNPGGTRGAFCFTSNNLSNGVRKKGVSFPGSGPATFQDGRKWASRRWGRSVKVTNQGGGRLDLERRGPFFQRKGKKKRLGQTQEHIKKKETTPTHVWEGEKSGAPGKLTPKYKKSRQQGESELQKNQRKESAQHRQKMAGESRREGDGVEKRWGE